MSTQIKQQYDLLQNSLLACKEYWQLKPMQKQIDDFAEKYSGQMSAITYVKCLKQTYSVMAAEIIVKQSKPNTVQHEQ